MSDEINRFGLSRKIPSEIRREVRQRCKFGCVVCRNGFITVEHIDPLFKDARKHDPDRMCCLCFDCQGRVTFGRLSKKTVLKRYEEVRAATADAVVPPWGPLDFSDGTAELQIGGILYQPAIRCLLRYQGVDFMRVKPGTRPGELGSISALFTDDESKSVLALVENEWVGSTRNWDIEVKGPRIVVRKKRGQILLQLRLELPGRIVVERLDMRIGDAHVLATEETYVMGRYVSESVVQWMNADLTILGSNVDGAALEFTTPELLRLRGNMATGKRLSDADGNVMCIGGVGAMIVNHGLCIGSGCNLVMKDWAMGPREISTMRDVIVRKPRGVRAFVGTGDPDAGMTI